MKNNMLNVHTISQMLYHKKTIYFNKSKVPVDNEEIKNRNIDIMTFFNIKKGKISNSRRLGKLKREQGFLNFTKKDQSLLGTDGF